MGKRKGNALTNSNGLCETSNKCEVSVINEDSCQDKSHSNVFELMMDSRNKSIGSNSPGKCKPIIETEEMIEKKDLKQKRKLCLQKMSEAKGSLKNKELEEYRDRHITKQLLKRSQAFKAMITQDKTEMKSKTHVQKPVKVENDDDICLIDVKKTLKLCNMFEESDAEAFHKRQNKKLSDEDKEFLSKLSPSIRKKENMLSYFPTMPKLTEENDLVLHDDYKKVIKVKLKTKHKKGNSSKKHHKETNHNSQDEIIDTTKCKQDVIEEVVNTRHSVNADCEVHEKETRPKRKTKRPSKYIDDAELESDDDLHIFTPKKKKALEKQPRLNLDKKIIDERNIKKTYKKREIVSNESKKETSKLKFNQKDANISNPVKLAPIFVSKHSNLSTAEKEARQRFLHSGIPEKLKKVQTQQHNSLGTIDHFYSVVHIQQNVAEVVSGNKPIFPYMDKSNTSDCLTINNGLFKALLSPCEEEKPHISLTYKNKEELLHKLKQSYVKFPVYRTYHLLKAKSRGENRDFNYPDLDNSVEIINNLANVEPDSVDKLCWADKFKPTSAKQIIGNFTAIDELKKWLQLWTENLVRNKHNEDSDSDFDILRDSDADSRESLKSFNNVLIICGEVGSGKTSSVYAVATELGIKVIEVNASSKRTGKIMLQDLQEATRSHKVNRGMSSSDNSQKVSDSLKTHSYKKRGRPTKAKGGLCETSRKNIYDDHNGLEEPSSQESLRQNSSLILIDDADIVFDQDDGFCAAVSQLIQSSKRPVILITSSISCQHLLKFLQYGKVINMHKFVPRMLGIWLDIMCIADTNTCFPGLGNELLDYFKGDIRKTINCLQFYMGSFKYSCKEYSQSQDIDINIEDESSSLSWSDHDYAGKLDTCQSAAVKNILQHVKLEAPGSTSNLFNVFWRLPEMYSEHNGHNKNQIKILSNMVNMISEADLVQADVGHNIWCPKASASINEFENMESYDRNKELGMEIASELAMLSLRSAQNSCRSETEFDLPRYNIEREQEKIISRHHKLTSYLNPNIVLDRRGLALDYWSSCRTICRLEKTKTDSNTKRNNRFCHYLKSLNVLCKNDYFDALSNSLTSNQIIDEFSIS
ncbi:unnamed protein product [Leptosia nina]|uniref:AAA+ ATPase domain-containing protein n=1 Tax=Leptosia nina TaxID=320188 RepID=A0AAV1K795_9NEOP